MIGIKKIPASALQFAILISVIVLILLGAFMTLTYTHGFFRNQSEFVFNSIDGVHDGFNLASDPSFQLQDSISILEGDNIISLEKKSWGGFIKVKSTASAKNKTFKKIALLGATTNNPKTAIYVSEPKLPLYLIGNTTIEGQCYAPKGNITSGIVSGNFFEGNMPPKNKIKNGKTSLPKLDKTWLKDIKMTLAGMKEDGVIISEMESNTNSFFKPINYISSNQRIIVESSITGNIIVRSASEIVIKRNARCEDVLFVAPRILVEQGFSGNVHILASENIKLEQNVNLKYPSSITLIDSRTDYKEGIPQGKEPIFIDSNSAVNGVVTYIPNELQDNKSFTSIKLQKNSLLVGSLYCQGNTEVLGTVRGSVYTERFVANAYGSKYANYIFNGTILGNNISDEFSGLPIESQQKSIAQWLY